MSHFGPAVKLYASKQTGHWFESTWASFALKKLWSMGLVL